MIKRFEIDKQGLFSLVMQSILHLYYTTIEMVNVLMYNFIRFKRIFKYGKTLNTLQVISKRFSFITPLRNFIILVVFSYI